MEISQPRSGWWSKQSDFVPEARWKIELWEIPTTLQDAMIYGPLTSHVVAG